MSSDSTFSLGFKSLFKGFSFLSRHPRLWPWVLFPLVLALLIFAGACGFSIHYFTPLNQWLLTTVGLNEIHNAGGFWGSIGFGLLWTLQQLIKPLLFLIGSILLSTIAFVVYLIIAAPFLELLAEKTGMLAYQKEPPPFSFSHLWRSVKRSISVELKKALFFLAINAIFWLLHWIPVAGSVVYIVLTSLFGTWALGFASIDYVMGLELLSFKERVQFAKRNKRALMGFGLPFLIPFAPLFLQAPMVVGGTLLYHELKARES